MKNMTTARGAMMAGLMICGVISVASAAGAVSGSGGGIYWQASANWDVAGVLLGTTTRNSAGSAVGNQYGPTDLNATYSGNAGTSCPSSAETCVYDDNYGNTGWYGIAECIGTTAGSDPNATCSRSQVRIDQYTGSPYVAGIAESPYNLCHEIGHSVGLRHTTSNTCLKRYVDGGSATFINQAEINELNAHY
jgi:hypothetical protein